LIFGPTESKFHRLLLYIIIYSSIPILVIFHGSLWRTTFNSISYSIYFLIGLFLTWMLFSSSHEIEDKSNSTYSLSKLRLLSFCVLTITALYAFGSITNYLLFFTDILKPQDHSNFSEYYNQKLKLVSYIKSPTLLLYLLITYILNKDLGVFSTIAFALIIIAAIINSIFSLIPAGHYQKAFYVIYGITTVVIYSRIGAASEEDTSIFYNF